MKILALDASTEAYSVALSIDGDVIQRFEHQPQQQAKLLLPACEAILLEAGEVLSNIDAIAFCNGPGSFTGLRVATAAAHGMAMSHDLPLLPVSTLLTLAKGEHRRTQKPDIAACIDARMSEVYFAYYCFQNADYATITKDAVLAPQDIVLPEKNDNIVKVGNGWQVYRQQFAFPVEVSEIRWPEAQDLAMLAAVDFAKNKAVAIEDALPVYIRDNVAAKKSRT